MMKCLSCACRLILCKKVKRYNNISLCNGESNQKIPSQQRIETQLPPGEGVGPAVGAGGVPKPVMAPVTPVTLTLLHCGAWQQIGSRGSGTIIHPGCGL